MTNVGRPGMSVATDRQGTLAGVATALVAAGLGLGTAFGLHITTQEHDAILTFCGAIALAAPVVGSIFDHGNKQVASRAATSVTSLLSGPGSTPSQADEIQAQIDALTAQKEALPK